jgi:hypothetical protein
MVASILCVPLKIPTAQAQANGAKVFVDPKNNVFDVTEKDVGDTFNVNVTIANMTGLVGFEFQLWWNSSLLEGVSMVENLFHTVTPEDEVDNIWRIKHAVTSDHVWYAYTWYDLNAAIEGGYAPINITVDNYPEGKLAAAIITLRIKSKPTIPGTSLSCVLNITYSLAGDKFANPISHTIEDGYYELRVPSPMVIYHTVMVDSLTFIVKTESNASISPVTLSIEDRALRFNATGIDGTTCFVNVTFPKDMLWSTDSWLVLVDSEPVTPQVSENATYTSLYITFTASQKTIQIIGTNVVPELQLWTVPLIFAVLAVISVSLVKRIKPKKFVAPSI